MKFPSAGNGTPAASTNASPMPRGTPEGNTRPPWRTTMVTSALVLGTPAGRNRPDEIVTEPPIAERPPGCPISLASE